VATPPKISFKTERSCCCWPNAFLEFPRAFTYSQIKIFFQVKVPHTQRCAGGRGARATHSAELKPRPTHPLYAYRGKLQGTTGSRVRPGPAWQQLGFKV